MCACVSGSPPPPHPPPASHRHQPEENWEESSGSRANPAEPDTFKPSLKRSSVVAKDRKTRPCPYRRCWAPGGRYGGVRRVSALTGGDLDAPVRGEYGAEKPQPVWRGVGDSFPGLRPGRSGLSSQNRPWSYNQTAAS